LAIVILLCCTRFVNLRNLLNVLCCFEIGMHNWQISELNLTLAQNLTPNPNLNPSQLSQRILQIARNSCIVHYWSLLSYYCINCYAVTKCDETAEALIIIILYYTTGCRHSTHNQYNNTENLQKHKIRNRTLQSIKSTSAAQ